MKARDGKLISPRRAAIEQHDIEPEDVDRVLTLLAEPDREILDAGAAELQHALPLGSTKGYARELAGVVWRAMLARAR